MAGDLMPENKPAPDQSKVFSLRGTYAPLDLERRTDASLGLEERHHDDVSSIIGINSTSIGSSSISSGDGREQRRWGDYDYSHRQCKPRYLACRLGISTLPGSTARTNQGEEAGERVVKRHIDYIMYTPFRRGPADPAFNRGGRRLAWGSGILCLLGATEQGGAPWMRTATATDQRSRHQERPTGNLGAAAPRGVHVWGDHSHHRGDRQQPLLQERVLVSMLAVIGLLVKFEVSSRGTIFKPEIEEEVVLESIFNEVRPDGDNIAGQSTTGMAITASRRQGERY